MLTTRARFSTPGASWRSRAPAHLGKLLIGLIPVTQLTGCGGATSQPATAPVLHSRQPALTSLHLRHAVKISDPRTTHNSHPRIRTPSKQSPQVSLSVSIAGLSRDGRIPARYTCDGANQPLAVHWSAVPRGTAQIAMFVVNLTAPRGKLIFDWAVAGLNPSAHGTSIGVTPPAVIARNSFGDLGYSLCPSRGTRESYVVRVLALSAPIHEQHRLTAQVLYTDAEHLAKTIGVAGGWYMRR